MPDITQAEATRRRKAIEARLAKGQGVAAAARDLGIAPGTLRSWWATNEAATPQRKAAVTPIPPSPAELHDAEFWRKKATTLNKNLRDAEHLVRELAGVREVPVTPPDWMTSTGKNSGHSILIAHTSDLHFGEVIRPDEISGLNQYDPDVARERMRRYFDAVCTIGPRWLEGGKCDGVLLTMAGDLISGDIHEELRITNALTSHEQVRGVVEIYDAGIRQVLSQFGAVHVAAVPGNHGRTTPKPTAKQSAQLSYDILAADILRDRFREVPGVTFAVATGADLRVPIYGRTALITHGDRMGTGGGQGFAGPVLPILRGGNKVIHQSHTAGLACDLILMGHYHLSAAPPGILANGSVVGYSEFGNSIRAAVDVPRQWLARFSHAWGLCETLAVQLEAQPQRLHFK